jgi:hypothetical protein
MTMIAQRAHAVILLLVLLASPVWAQPSPATPLTPSSDVVGSTIAFTWEPSASATWYQLWLGRSDTSVVLDRWFTAEHAGCVGGGTCTVTLTPPLTAGAYVWHVRPWSSAGYGGWSAAYMFTLRDIVQAWTGTLPPSRRFTVVMNGDAVLDNETGLVWQRTPSSTAYAWPPTRAICGSANTGGRLGWRAPTLAELSSMIDPSRIAPAFPPGHPFVLILPINFWSQTESSEFPDFHFAVSFFSGTVLADTLASQYRVWCVRGGATALR